MAEAGAAVERRRHVHHAVESATQSADANTSAADATGRATSSPRFERFGSAFAARDLRHVRFRAIGIDHRRDCREELSMHEFAARRRSVALIGFGLLIAVGAHAGEATPALTKEIIGVTQQLMTALGDGKADVWQRVLADDVLITDEFGRRQTKKEAVDSMHPFPTGISGAIEIRDAHVRAYGDTAVIDCEAYETEDYFGHKFVVRYLFTSTYVRHDKSWQLVAMQDVTLPTAPPVLDVGGLVPTDYVGTYPYAPERAFIVETEDGRLTLRTRKSAPAHVLDPIAKDVFMGSDDERNLLIFRRDAQGKVVELIERRKFNDLHAPRDAS
jgi:hypothetical protein